MPDQWKNPEIPVREDEETSWIENDEFRGRVNEHDDDAEVVDEEDIDEESIEEDDTTF